MHIFISMYPLLAVSSSCPAEPAASVSQPTNPTPQLPPSTVETPPITASMEPSADETLPLSSDKTASVQPSDVTLPLPNDETTVQPSDKILPLPSDETMSVQPSDETLPLPGDGASLVNDTSASSLPADETTALATDDTTSSSHDSLSPSASDEEPSPSPHKPENSHNQENSQEPEPEGSCEAEMSETESIPTSFDYSLKLDPGKQIREYQKELAKPGIEGKNYIVVAPTGSGKTLVAALVISDHLEKNQHKDDKPKVVFIVNTKPLAEQQKKELEKVIPGAEVGCSMGDGGPAIFDLLPHNNIIVCTAGKLLDAIRGGKVTFDKISLIVID